MEWIPAARALRLTKSTAPRRRKWIPAARLLRLTKSTASKRQSGSPENQVAVDNAAPAGVIVPVADATGKDVSASGLLTGNKNMIVQWRVNTNVLTAQASTKEADPNDWRWLSVRSLRLIFVVELGTAGPRHQPRQAASTCQVPVPLET